MGTHEHGGHDHDDKHDDDKHDDHGDDRHGHHGRLPYHDPDYDEPMVHRTEPPDNARYPERRIYGQYASQRPPQYVPHPIDHSCFRPRKQDYRPPVTCDDPHDGGCHRQDSRALTADQQTRFLNAFSQANAMGALGPLVDIHANATHQMHSNPRFLPWHHIYLLRFEELLQSIDPTVCLPYWKASEEQAFPAWLSGFTPTVTLLGGPHLVTRNIGAFASLPTAADVATVMANATFNPFGGGLEGIHNSGHVWVGGSMGIITTAPADPIFWMHHAEIDRIWSEWQAANPGEHPPLAGSAATMDPWSETEVDTRDISALGYSYV